MKQCQADKCEFNHEGFCTLEYTIGMEPCEKNYTNYDLIACDPDE